MKYTQAVAERRQLTSKSGGTEGYTRVYEARLAAVVIAVRTGDLRYAGHALAKMRDRGIDPRALERALSEGDPDVIEDYPLDPRGPSCLVLCRAAGRALHVVVSFPPRPRVITAYWPDTEPHEWDAEFRRRVR